MTVLSHSANIQAKAPFIQPKIKVNTPGDRYEQEADAMADRVMRMPQAQPTLNPSMTPLPAIQRKCAACEAQEEEHIHRKETTSQSPSLSPSQTHQLNSRSGNGHTLPTHTQQMMGQAFGRDFGEVRVHTGTQAANLSQAVHARAFTYGSDIYFNQGEYQPDTQAGKHLLAHELTHVVQQGGTRQQIQRQASEADPECPSGKTTVRIDFLSFRGSTRDPYADMAAANRIYAPCCVQFVAGEGKSVRPGLSDPLMGNDTTFERATRAVDSPEETALIPEMHRTFNLNGRLHAFYFEQINPRARGTAHRQTGSSALTVNHIYMTNTAADRTLAHEIGHILLDGNFHHLPADNLMHPSNTATGSNLTEEQCETIRNNI